MILLGISKQTAMSQQLHYAFTLDEFLNKIQYVHWNLSPAGRQSVREYSSC